MTKVTEDQARRLLENPALEVLADEHLAGVVARWMECEDPETRNQLWHEQSATRSAVFAIQERARGILNESSRDE